MAKNHGKHAEHAKKVEDAFHKAGGGAAGLTAGLRQIVENARSMDAEHAQQRAELEAKQQTERKDAIDHLLENLPGIVAQA